MTASASGQVLQRPKHERKSLPLDHPRSAGNYPKGGSLLNDNPGSVPGDNQQRRFHDMKQADNPSRPKDQYSVNPDTGEVADPEGEILGRLD